LVNHFDDKFDSHDIFFYMKISAEDIKSVILSEDFGNEMQELSAYTANIRQERPIVTLIAKHLWRCGYEVALEKKKCDLVVGETKIEFKFSFDHDTYNLKRELDKYKDDLVMIMNDVFIKKLNGTWTVSPAILKDVVEKRPQIFVWILCRRDLSNLSEEELSRVCIASDQLRYNRNQPFRSNESEFLQIVNRFITKLQEFRNFKLEKITMATNGSFPSVYYFMLCEFEK
jgi:hypothetical protein